MLSAKKMLIAGLSKKLRTQDVFATSLYTGNDGAQTFTTGFPVDFVWAMPRNVARNHALFDSVRGPFALITNRPDAEVSSVVNFTSSGWSINGRTTETNVNGDSVVAYAFRRAKKFLDIVTYVGDGGGFKQVLHGLGTEPGMIIIKRRDAGGANWSVYHRVLGTDRFLRLNSTAATASSANSKVNSVSATDFTVGTDGEVNAAGAAYIAYVFAHNPDLIDCGVFTGNGSSNGPLVTCGTGWRPQFIIAKNTNANSNWSIFDTARGIQSGNDPQLRPNTAAVEVTNIDWLDLTALGFQPKSDFTTFNQSGGQIAYLAVREPT